LTEAVSKWNAGYVFSSSLKDMQ